jgi:hypothetical protein
VLFRSNLGLNEIFAILGRYGAKAGSYVPVYNTLILKASISYEFVMKTTNRSALTAT